MKSNSQSNHLDIVNLFLEDNAADFIESTKTAIQVSVRISFDFYKSLSLITNIEDINPPDLSYLIGTIRSGIDFYFDLLYANHNKLKGEINKFGEWPTCSNFQTFKAEFSKNFKKLQKSKLTLTTRISVLLKIIKMMIIFVGVYFY